MESENIEEISNLFNDIDIENNAENKNEVLEFNGRKAQPTLRRVFPTPIDFEKYVEENYDNKFKTLDRSTFHQIRRPVVIMFNHFREKCVYHTKWLDRIFQLALKYSNQIEFIAADMNDIDVIYPKCSPYIFYSRFVKPENETPFIYFIDQKKRIHHYDIYTPVESLSKLCENLLNGNLYPSQPIPKNNDTNLVKICVHDNYEELVLKSSKDICFIVDLGKRFKNQKYEPNYENVAFQLKDYDVDIIHMEAEDNYVPFEYHVNCYPKILFIPHNDKTNFVCFEENRTEENIIAFLKNVIGQPNVLKQKQEEQQSRDNPGQNHLMVPNEFEMDFNNLPQFLKENFNNEIHVLDRKTLNKTKTCIIIVYMNFQGKCLAHHVRCLNKIYLIAKNSYTVQYLVADFKDIDFINTKWSPSTFVNNAHSEGDIQKIFAMDYFKHTYEFTNYTTPASLFYFESSLRNGDFYYSQRYPKNQDGELVKTCVADSLNIFIKQSKKDLFITFYQSDLDNTEQLLKVLEDVAKVVKDFNVDVVKFNATENYVDLEYARATYPAHYFISRHNKKENYLLINNDLNREVILEFIKKCL